MRAERARLGRGVVSGVLRAICYSAVCSFSFLFFCFLCSGLCDYISNDKRLKTLSPAASGARSLFPSFVCPFGGALVLLLSRRLLLGAAAAHDGGATARSESFLYLRSQ